MKDSGDEELKQVLRSVGACKTIYSLVMPETEAIKRKVFGGDQKTAFEQTLQTAGTPVDADALLRASERARAPYFELFREAWTQKQDLMHQAFFERWRSWVRPIVRIASDDFTFQYPTAGASEGLRALIDEYGARARRDHFEPHIHVFAGDYEGFVAYAEAAYIPVIRHDRGDWLHAIADVSQASANRPAQWYISQPSSIDGNVWPDFDVFVRALADKSPNTEIIVDLTYVGCITQDATIRTNYPNIPALVLSLSKPMGAYYDRIGGALARAPYPALFGNMWFKNLTSLAIGTQFMTTYGVTELPRKYATIQRRATDTIMTKLKALGHDVVVSPSDVFLLASGEMPANPGVLHRHLARAADRGNIVRLCLTPTMAAMIGMAQTRDAAQSS
jgi:hypothetical protein